MNINSSRYYDACGIQGMNKKTFLNQWNKKAFNSFYKKYEKEFDRYHTIWREVYETTSLFSGERDRKLKEVDKRYKPSSLHPVEYFFASIPKSIESWLCCGFRLCRDKTTGQKTWNDNYHMVSKLARYETWPDVKITWWDKIRFKLITGYRFE